MTIDRQSTFAHGTTRRLALPGMGEFRWVLPWAFIAVSVALLDGPVFLRVVFGLPFVLFIPGYTLVSALFPSRSGLDGLERIAVSFALSLALMPFAALAIDYSPWSVSLGPMLFCLFGATILFSTVAIARRARITTDSHYRPTLPRLRIPRYRAWDRSVRIASGGVLLSVLLLVGSGATIVIPRLQGESFTEFAVYNSEGKPEFYPQHLTPGETATVVVEVTNQENRADEYRLRIHASGQEIDVIEQITIDDGQTWREPVEFRMPDTRERVPITFELYRLDQPEGDEPYRTLRLVVGDMGS